MFSLKAVECGCTTLEEKCLLSVSAIAPFLFRAPTATSVTAGTLPQCARSLQVCYIDNFIYIIVFLSRSTIFSVIFKAASSKILFKHFLWKNDNIRGSRLLLIILNLLKWMIQSRFTKAVSSSPPVQGCPLWLNCCLKRSKSLN